MHNDNEQFLTNQFNLMAEVFNLVAGKDIPTDGTDTQTTHSLTCDSSRFDSLAPTERPPLQRTDRPTRSLNR